MLNTSPKSFITICKIAEIPEEEIQPLWLNIWEKSISELLNWLTSDIDLSDEQLGKTEEVFANIGNSGHEKSIIELLKPILDDNQLKMITDKFADLLTTNLDGFYTDLKAKMTLEQKQVLDSFIKSTNV